MPAPPMLQPHFLPLKKPNCHDNTIFGAMYPMFMNCH